MPWQLEHSDRQARLALAIDRQYISENNAELLDSMDNLLRYYWIKHEPVILVSTN